GADAGKLPEAWSQAMRRKRGIILHCMNDPQPEGHLARYIARRKLLATLGGAAAWPLAARAQQGERMQRIGGLLVGGPEPLGPFHEALTELGYVAGENIQIEGRSAQEPGSPGFRLNAFPGVSLSP